MPMLFAVIAVAVAQAPEQVAAPQVTAASLSSPVIDREVTIRALRDEVAELEDERSGVGYVFPSLVASLGIGAALYGTLALTGTTGPQAWLRPTLQVAGGLIAGLAVTWLVVRIAKVVRLNGDIDDKREQLRALEARRLETVR